MLPMLAAVDPVFLGQRDLGVHFKTKSHATEPLVRTQPHAIYTSPVVCSRIRPSFKRVSPMDKLPVELLAHIFLLATHQDSSADTEDADEVVNDNLPFNPDNIPTPLAISAVNRQWRQIALTTPGLWSSICVVWEEVDDIMEVDESQIPLSSLRCSTTLNIQHINTSLARSGSSPIDIIIDARDPDWDFAEPESRPDTDGFDTYQHPFPAAHMYMALNLLFPHIYRWRSLAILTDTWAPMYTALSRLESIDVSFEAPLLETLTLMRCNEFVSHSPQFTPSHMKNPFFLPFAGMLRGGKTLPRLHDLVLSGVHLDWTRIPSLIPSTGLQHLELSYHSLEVRPNLTQFRQILRLSPGLRSLIVDVSGPSLNGEEYVAGLRPHDAVYLPYLEEITLGYTDASDGCLILGTLDAPYVRTLVLEDGSHPAVLQEVDAAGLLIYCGTSVPKIASSWANHGTNSSMEDIIDDGSDGSLRLPFLRLEELALRRVKCVMGPFQTLFGSLTNLQRLRLDHTSRHAVDALLPSDGTGTIPCPCPELKTLWIRGIDCDLNLTCSLSDQRVRAGACELLDLDIFVDQDENGFGERLDLMNVQVGPGSSSKH